MISQSYLKCAVYSTNCTESLPPSIGNRARQNVPRAWKVGAITAVSLSFFCQKVYNHCLDRLFLWWLLGTLLPCLFWTMCRRIFKDIRGTWLAWGMPLTNAKNKSNSSSYFFIQIKLHFNLKIIIFKCKNNYSFK